MQLKNSLKTFLGYLKNHYPRQKFAIGSFLIVILLGFLSVRALATADHLIAWAPQDTSFYLHIKIQKADPVWQKIKTIKPFPEIDYSLNDLIPPKSSELAVFQQNDKIAILVLSGKQPSEFEQIKTTELENEIFLISGPETAKPQKSDIINIAVLHGLGQEPLTAAGYLYINGASTPGHVPKIIEPWQAAIETKPQAWSLEITDEIIVWKNQKQSSAQSIELRSPAIPQNTLVWTHGNNWQQAWQSSLLQLPQSPSQLSVAASHYEESFNDINNPKTSFQPLFTNPFDLFIIGDDENQTFTLKIKKNQDDNPIWINNFREYWLKQVKKGLPSYTLITLPDGSRAVEMTANEMLSWQEQNVTNSAIHWLKGPNDKFIIGYLNTADSLIISNNYGNLVDFVYGDDQKGWLNLENLAKTCDFQPNYLESYMLNLEDSANLSQIINILGPYIINTQGDICHI